jgi:hypothetical protein
MEYILNNKPIILSKHNNNIIFNCFDNLSTHINVNYYYTLLNKLNDIDMNNLINYINMKWHKMKKLIIENFQDDNIYINLNINKNDKNNDLNDILNNFIKSDKILSIFVINCIHKLFY